MIRQTISMDHSLSQIEALLKINSNCPSIEEQVKLSRHAIETEIYETIPEGTSIYSLTGHNKVDDFLGSCIECLKNFALLVCIESYDLNFGQSLKSLNYLGAPAIEIMNSFRILAKQSLQSQKVQFMDDIIKAFSSVKPCELRRLVCVIAVLDNLGISDGVAILAEHIVLGGRA